jgi:hypothetical protein
VPGRVSVEALQQVLEKGFAQASHGAGRYYIPLGEACSSRWAPLFNHDTHQGMEGAIDGTGTKTWNACPFTDPTHTPLPNLNRAPPP